MNGICTRITLICIVRTLSADMAVKVIVIDEYAIGSVVVGLPNKKRVHIWNLPCVCIKIITSWKLYLMQSMNGRISLNFTECVWNNSVIGMHVRMYSTFGRSSCNYSCVIDFFHKLIIRHFQLISSEKFLITQNKISNTDI